MRKQGIPTLFLPNMNTGMDDQLARCKVAEDEGWGIVSNPSSSINIEIQNLLNQSCSNFLETSVNGANTLAEMLLVND